MNKVVLITGGAQGIGKGTAAYLLKQDMKVVIADIDKEAGEETVQEYGSLGFIRFIPTDVTREDSVKQTVIEAVGSLGRLDALINNAAIADPGNTPLEELSLEAWNRILCTNLTGCFLAAKHAIPYLKQSRGSIVNIASTRALQSEPNTEAYSASKGGVTALTHAMAVSLGPEIRVNCISPGWIEVSSWKKKSRRKESELRPVDHRQHPVGRVGQPEDIAVLAAFLISEAAGFVTGQNFISDGGMTRKMIYAE